jgi:hypothetical protein
MLGIAEGFVVGILEGFFDGVVLDVCWLCQLTGF